MELTGSSGQYYAESLKIGGLFGLLQPIPFGELVWKLADSLRFTMH
jgi:hypothetical protein